MNPMWAETDAMLELKKAAMLELEKAGMFKKTCANCEWNIEDIIIEPWCTKHDIDKLPLFGCGDWRVSPTLKGEITAVDGAQMQNMDQEVRGWRWRISTTKYQ